MSSHFMNDSFSEWSVLCLEEECESNLPSSEGGKHVVEPLFCQCPSGVQSLKYSGLRKRKLLMRGAQGAIYAACDTIEPEHPREVVVKRLYGQHDASYAAVGVEVSVLRETSLLSYLMKEQEKTLMQGGQCSTREGGADDRLQSTFSRTLSPPPKTMDHSARILALHRIVEAPMEDICLVLEACDLDMEQLCAFSRYPPVFKDWENRDGVECTTSNGVLRCRMNTPRDLSDDESGEGGALRENLAWEEGWSVGVPLALDFCSESSEEFTDEEEDREKENFGESKRQVEDEDALKREVGHPHRRTPAQNDVQEKSFFSFHSSFPNLKGMEMEHERETNGPSSSPSTPPAVLTPLHLTEDAVPLGEKRTMRDVPRSSFPCSGGASPPDDVQDASPFDHSGGADHEVQVAGGLFPSHASLHHKRDAFCPLLRELPLIRYLLRRFLRVLCFLHDTCHVCHRDIKPTNWLIRKEVEGGRGCGIRLGDFGSARLLSFQGCDKWERMRDLPRGEGVIVEGEERDGNGSTVRNGKDVAGAPLTPSTFRTTRCYISPECILGKAYDFKVDIWALGVVFVELILQRHLFFSISEVGVLSEIYTLLTPSSEKRRSTVESVDEESLEASPMEGEEPNSDDPLFSTGLSALIAPLMPAVGVKFAHELLALNPDSRLSASQALCHPFLHFEGWKEEDTLGERLLRQKLELF